MYTDPSRRKENTNQNEKFENDQRTFVKDEFNSFDFYGSSNVISRSKNERMSAPSKGSILDTFSLRYFIFHVEINDILFVRCSCSVFCRSNVRKCDERTYLAVN